MFCYGEKESWYKKICPNGMLPALELDGKLYTESDRIIGVLEGAFGSLQAGLVINTILLGFWSLSQGSIPIVNRITGLQEAKFSNFYYRVK